MHTAEGGAAVETRAGTPHRVLVRLRRRGAEDLLSPLGARREARLSALVRLGQPCLSPGLARALGGPDQRPAPSAAARPGPRLGGPGFARVTVPRSLARPVLPRPDPRTGASGLACSRIARRRRACRRPAPRVAPESPSVPASPACLLPIYVSSATVARPLPARTTPAARHDEEHRHGAGSCSLRFARGRATGCAASA